MRNKYAIISILILVLLITAGCAQNKKINDEISKGQAALADEKIDLATEHFQAAIKIGESDVATHYLNLIKLAREFNINVENEAYDKAIDLFNDLTTHKYFDEIKFFTEKNIKHLEKVISKREEIEEEINHLESYYDKNDLSAVPDPLYKETVNNILEMELVSQDQTARVKALEKLIKEREKTLAVVPEQNEPNKPIKQEKPIKSDKPVETNKNLTLGQAESKVYRFLVNIYSEETLKQPNLHLNYDHNDENGNYIFQFYEVVITENEDGHTATWGWYGVNPSTGEIFDAFN